jgi:hypothetical protein
MGDGNMLKVVLTPLKDIMTKKESKGKAVKKMEGNCQGTILEEIRSLATENRHMIETGP